jgi:hypothetical protein
MTEKNRAIPVHEPEVVAAEARKKWHGNAEKVATTSIKMLKIDGVEITSRYCRALEFELMRDMVLALSPRWRAIMKSIFCDSKATDCFSVTMRRWDPRLATEIGKQLESAALELNDGHNGITIAAATATKPIFGDAGRRIDIHPNWCGDWLR